MKIRKGIDKHWYAVFPSNYDAERWEWLFIHVLRRRVACFGQYENAYLLF